MGEKEANSVQGMSASGRLQGIDPAVLQQLMQLMTEKKTAAGSEMPIMLSAAQNASESSGRNQDINLVMQLLEQRLAPEEKRKWETLRMMAALLGIR